MLKLSLRISKGNKGLLQELASSLFLLQSPGLNLNPYLDTNFVYEHYLNALDNVELWNFLTVGKFIHSLPPSTRRSEVRVCYRTADLVMVTVLYEV